MVEVESNLLEKRVRVIHRNGYVKIGVLKKVTDRYIVLQLFNSEPELISFEAIDTVKLDGGR